MIYTVHFFDACDCINTRITTHHADVGAAQAQYNRHVQASEDLARVELVMFDPATLTERVLQQDDLNL
jgi:hypothetical protein